MAYDKLLDCVPHGTRVHLIRKMGQDQSKSLMRLSGFTAAEDRTQLQALLSSVGLNSHTIVSMGEEEAKILLDCEAEELYLTELTRRKMQIGNAQTTLSISILPVEPNLEMAI